MKREDIDRHAGKPCLVNGDGDLFFNEDLRPVIRAQGARIVRLTKGGKALVELNGQTVAVPPRNVDLLSPPSEETSS